MKVFLHRLFECIQCHATFTAEDDLGAHLHSCCKQSTFTCKVCKKMCEFGNAHKCKGNLLFHADNIALFSIWLLHLQIKNPRRSIVAVYAIKRFRILVIYTDTKNYTLTRGLTAAPSAIENFQLCPECVAALFQVPLKHLNL